MSTRSRIAIKQKDGIYKSIYCHSDGYLEYNGVILNKYYQDETKINLLINLGDISSLGCYVYPDTTKDHNFLNPQKDVTVAYHRDRGENLNFRVDNDKDSLIKNTVKSDQEYLYLYENKQWFFADTRSMNYEDVELYNLEDILRERLLLDENMQTYDISDEIANNLIQYAKDFDFYEYRDSYDNDEVAINEIKEMLSTKDGIYTILDSLTEDIKIMATEKDMCDPEVCKISKNAFDLINRLNQYLVVLENTKDNEIDM